jgi:hypothetical protein
MKSKINFEFSNHISPRYIHPLFLQLNQGVWYSTPEMADMLRNNGLGVEGSNIVQGNVQAWTLLRFGDKKIDGHKLYFRINDFGSVLQQIYSTNQELFFDLIHYFMYSVWHSTKNPLFGKFWLYSSACEKLWENAPSQMDSFGLTGLLQQEALDVFPGYSPKFSERSITAVFGWLGSLTPSFLSKKTKKSQLTSERREFCSPQLFHLALDLIYSQKRLKYGTSVAIGEEEIKAISRACLLDENQFWEMADRTKMIIRGVDIRRGQFSTSIALDKRPQWIDLPDYSTEMDFENGFGGDDE